MDLPFPSDYEIVYFVRQNDEWSQRLLINKYHRSIWAIIHSILPSPTPKHLSLDELYQEGCIGLLEAADSYRDDMGVTFGTFARVCIEREIRSLMRKYRSASYSLLSNSLSLDMSVSEDDNLLLMDTIACTRPEYDPRYAADLSWAHDQLEKLKETLPAEQWLIYQKHAEGYSYREIAKMIGCSDKTVDNTLQRIRKKLATLFD